AAIINIEEDFEIDKEVEVEITPGGESASEQVTFNCKEAEKIKIGKKSLFLGTLIAPEAKVILDKSVRFRGAICANEIEVKKSVRLLHHTSGGSLPKAAPEDEDEEALITSVPTEFQLEQNYPNPFNPSTTISFALPRAGEVRLSIFNIKGQLVQTLLSGPLAAGRHRIVWDGTDARGARVASGFYIYRLRANELVADKTLVLMK
ncbi:T9SS type A sorting domain-containing protein, partial [bacterium]|nr:T9SS type A sorting domain-containing protein [bacterium]